MMQLLDGKALAKKVRDQIKERAALFVEKRGRMPVLAVVLVGNNPASEIYIKNKKRACKKSSIESRQHLLSADTSQEELVDLVQKLNRDDEVDGILVQLPLPEQIDENTIIETISAEKDADGFHPVNLGRLLAGKQGLAPCKYANSNGK